MIFFVTRQYHDYTVANFLQTWARSLIGKVAILSYEECAFATRLHRGVYVFTDFERMRPEQHELARLMAGQLARAGCRVLNHPDHVLDRVSLQKELFAAGMNSFNAYLDTDDLTQVRFPCFVRRVSAHEGRVSELLHSREELLAEIRRRRAAGENDLMITERIEVRSADGLYRKYGVFRCGDALAPRHVYFSQNWVQNFSDLVDDAKVGEEAEFVEANPHAEQVRRVFELAGVDYGRIDYGIVNGRVQTWEINTNPMMMAAPYRLQPPRLPAMARGTERARQAIEAIDDGIEFSAQRRENWIGLKIPAKLKSRLGVRSSDAMLRIVGRALGRIGQLPGLKELVYACHRARWLAMR